MKADHHVNLRVSTLGAAAVCTQTLLMRELLGIVTGTELVLGLALASWLLWTAAGGLAGGRAISAGGVPAARAFPRLAAAVIISLPLTVLTARAGRVFLVDPPGSMPPALPAAAFIAFAPAPFGILYGALYNSASDLLKRRGSMREGITGAYVMEASGSVAGGLLLSLLLFRYLTQLESAFTVSAGASVLFLLTSAAGKRSGWLILSIAAVIGTVYSPALDRASMSVLFKGYELLEVVPSKYSELCVTKERETVSVFSGGARVMSLPDVEVSGERSHIPLLAHPDPRSALFIGAGNPEVMEEALSHPGVERISWTELDGSLRDALGSASLEDLEKRGSERVEGDGRSLIGGLGPFDVISVDVPEPVSLRWNRYFTAEFFEQARSALAQGGILTLRHSSSENFLSARNAAVLGIIRATLSGAFEHVGAVPGSSVYFVASDAAVDPLAIPRRSLERGLGGRLLVIDDLPYRISPERMEDLESSLEDAPVEVNTDSYPVLVPHELALHGWKSGSYTGEAIAPLLDMPRWSIPAVLVAAAVLVMVLSVRRGAARCAVFITGMSCMTVQVMVMLAFQAFSGVLYHMLALLTALFMAGAALGASARGPGIRALHLLMAAAALLVPAALTLLPSGSRAGTAVFLALSAAGGFLAGMYYRKVVLLAWPPAAGAPAALFYSWDLIGACAGALIAGSLLVPLSGMLWAALAMAAVHAAAALLLGGRVAAGG